MGTDARGGGHFLHRRPSPRARSPSGVKEGDAVIVPTMTFAATAEVGPYLGGPGQSWSIAALDEFQSRHCRAERRIEVAIAEGQRVTCIMPVHYSGQNRRLAGWSRWPSATAEDRGQTRRTGVRRFFRDRDDGTAGTTGHGTTGLRDDRTAGRRDDGTTGRQDEGLRDDGRLRDYGTTGRRDCGTTGHGLRDSRTAGRRDCGTMGVAYPRVAQR